MEWKLGNVMVRPISLTLIAAKVFESIITKWVDETIESETDAKKF